MRRGVTLIEMVVVITVGSVLTGIAVSLLLVLLRAEQGGRAHAERSASLQQLADQFRRDVHAAVEPPEVNDKAKMSLLVVDLDDRVVYYDMSSNVILRSETQEGKELCHDSYSLPEDSTVAFAVVGANKKQPTIRLIIAPKDEALRSVQEICIDAVACRDGRFQNPTPPKPEEKKK